MKILKNKKILLLILMVLVFSLATSFYLLKKDEAPELMADVYMSNTSDIVFINVSDNIDLGEIVPTLDKFGLLNKAFSFTLKNNATEKKNYTLRLVDDNSTILNKMIRYELTKNNENLGIHSLGDDGIIDIAEIENEEITYSLKLWLDYNSDVKIGTLKKKVSVEENESLDTTLTTPQLIDGMIPVYYDLEKMAFCKSDINNSYYYKWYDYDNGIWANAITVDINKRDEYLNSPLGTKIDIKDINSMWVWIPRFIYTMINNQVEVYFVSKDNYSSSAFNFNDYAADGFWVSKFEAGLSEDDICITSSITSNCNRSNKNLLFKPNIPFMNRITMANLFYAIRNMELKDNIYGFNGGDKLNSDGTIKNDNNNYDIHLIKNSEWESISILSLSKYGRGNKEIYPNNGNYTGQAFYDNKVYNFDTYNGFGASTTNNVSGVYDMVGGKREYVMINDLNSNIFNKKSNSGFTGNIKNYYYDTKSEEEEVLATINQGKYNPNSEPVTRGGYRLVDSNILSLYGAKDYVNKISLETNSRAVITFIKEK